MHIYTYISLYFLLFFFFKSFSNIIIIISSMTKACKKKEKKALSHLQGKNIIITLCLRVLKIGPIGVLGRNNEIDLKLLEIVLLFIAPLYYPENAFSRIDAAINSL